MIKNEKITRIHIMSILIVILSLVATSFGLFYTTGGEPYFFTNQYGDLVKIFGDGLYAHDSYFMAEIFKGTDLSILCIAIPLLVTAIVIDIRKRTMKSRLFLMSVISVFAYYSAGLVFGMTYNFLQLVYIALFSLCVFGLIMTFIDMSHYQIAKSVSSTFSKKAAYVFLVLTGFALVVAWLPDIIGSLIEGRSLELIEVYTTQITYVLDMGIVGPAALVGLFMIKKDKDTGYVILAIMLIICSVVGLMTPVQVLFQSFAGIEMPIGAIVTKVVTFVLLSIFALYITIKFFKSINIDTASS